MTNHPKFTESHDSAARGKGEFMKRLFTSLIVCSAALLVGCASRHPHMDKPVALGEPHWNCDINNKCSLVQDWEPSQLTPAGCVLHKIVTFGHTAQECKKPKKGTK